MTFSSVCPLCSITLDDLDQVRHEVVALLELNVDVGEGLTAALAQSDEPVVGHDRPNTCRHDDGDDHPADGAHAEPPLQIPYHDMPTPSLQ